MISDVIKKGEGAALQTAVGNAVVGAIPLVASNCTGVQTITLEQWRLNDAI
ncbi:MAG TPA: hypothetical protein VLL52_14800 [Anaerolineae bacterium]|nr:hypothetical protein [Anaerolineae bacterium]